MPKHTTYTKIMMILTALFILSSLVSLSFILFMGVFALAFVPLLTIIVVTANILFIVLGIIYLTKLYNLKKDCIKWSHIVFTILLLLFTVQVINNLVQDTNEYMMYKLNAASGVNYINYDESNFSSALTIDITIFLIKIAILISIWITFTKHLKKSEAEKIMIFS